MDDSHRLLFLLQVATAAFPTGAFNHSYGFETWIDREEIDGAAAFERACLDWLVHTAAPLDGVAVAHAQRAAAKDDSDALVLLDGLVGSMRLTRESRDASIKTGQSFLRTYCEVFDVPPVLRRYAAAVEAGSVGGHQPVAFGVAAGAFGLSTADAVLAHLQSSLSNLAAVAARLVPIGQLETQRILKRAWPTLIACTLESVETDLAYMGANMASLDIASMQHEGLHTRLCMS